MTRTRTGASARTRQQLSAKRLAILYRAASSLKPDPRNPRQHGRRQILQLATSIRTFGFLVPILVDRDGRIIVGHARQEAALELGMDEVPVIEIESLTERQRQAFVIADNRLAELASWNDQLLAESFKELAAVDLDFSIEATGFDMAEIDLRIQGLDGNTQADDPADDLAEVAVGPSVTRLGDLWILDRHRILCGNSLEETSYRTLMQGELAKLGIADPPYNVPIHGHVSGLGSIRHREFVMASGELSKAEFDQFLTRATKLMAQHSAAGSVHFVFMDWRHVDRLLEAGRLAFSELLNICVWVKHAGGMGGLYRSLHELICVFRNGRGRHRNNVQLGKYGRNRTNVWNYPGANAFGRAGGGGKLLALHPTVKPVALLADAILDCSARGDIVLDPFIGIASSIAAADRVGRRCYGIELDPLYVDIGVRRWQMLTGERARHAKSGRLFDELEQERVHDEKK